MEIRQFREEDAEQYRALRLEALRNEPEAFASSYEENRRKPLAETVKRIRAQSENNISLGAFLDKKCVGMVALIRKDRKKTAHKADLMSMYVSPDARGKGIGKALVKEVIAWGRQMEGLEQIQLTVVSTNETARNLYLSAGFSKYGTEPMAMKIGESYYDEDWMTLFLTAIGGEQIST
ncbi:MAG TPA: GNAT family N-acetyltransferase [Bacillales bacterium]